MNSENMKKFIAAFAAKHADQPCTMPFGEVIDGMQKYYEVIGMTVDLINLINEESALKKHHRAYLHVREELEDKADTTMERIRDLLAETTVTLIHEDDAYPFADAEDVDEEETITIPKAKYDLMVEDLLTMAELIDMVSDMRTKDVRFIQEMGKLIPAYAEYEENRVSLYREAAKEAEDIINRWDDELDEDYEPDEFFSD